MARAMLDEFGFFFFEIAFLDGPRVVYDLARRLAEPASMLRFKSPNAKKNNSSTGRSDKPNGVTDKPRFEFRAGRALRRSRTSLITFLSKTKRT